MNQSAPPAWRRLLSSRVGVVLLGFLVLAGYLLWVEHKAHMIEFLPLALFLAVCLGAHYFMHRGFGGRHESDDEEPKDDGR